MQDVKKILIITADACHTKFYIASGPHKIASLISMENPAARLHERDFTTKEHEINTCPYEDIKKPHEEQIFAKHLIAVLEKYLLVKHIHEVCVFAAPKFLGMLKKLPLKNHTRVTWIAKNFMHGKEDLTVIQNAIMQARLSFLPEY